jgi:YD repeat-containing protein
MLTTAYRLRLNKCCSALATLLACLLLGSCGSSGIKPAEMHVPSLRVTDSAGVVLPPDYARMVQTPRGFDIFATDPAASGFELSYDPLRQQAVQVVRGDYFASDDLYLAVTSVPGLVAVGGHSFKAVELPPGGALVASIELQDGPAAERSGSATLGVSAKPQAFGYIDNGDGTASFSWEHHNVGDYDQDGEVNIADLTPVGVHFKRVSGDANWAAASIADGDENGEVNVADLTPIGQHFKTLVSGYALEQSATATGPYTAGADLPVSAGVAQPRKTYTHTLVPVESGWYRVRAYSADDPDNGPASDPLQVSLLPPGQNPVAVLGTDAISGPIPLTVNFTAAGSSDADGTIVKYEWDLDGNGSFETDATAGGGTALYTYEEQGSYPVKLRVTDNDARFHVVAVVINAGPPPDSVPPGAKAYVMPDEGWLPLTVQLSPFGSADDTAITSWSWDLDGDGSFETDATATAGYTSTTFSSAGLHVVTLRVADAQDNAAAASVTINALDPALSSVDYDNVFRQDSVDRIDLAVTQGNWDAMWDDPQAELEVPADIVIFGESLPSIGLSMKGNSSLNGPGEKKPWKLDINDNDPLQVFHNMKELVLNNGFKDPSLLRERMAYELLYNAGVSCSHTSSVEVWIAIGGAEAEFFGVYTLVERVDKKFIDNRYFDDGGNL